MTGARIPAARRPMPSSDWWIAAAMVALAALCRFPRLVQTPGWDGDEGYNLEIAWQLAHGRAQYFALDYSFVQHPPFFYALAAPALAVYGRDLAVLRAVSAGAGALTCGVLYLAMAGAGRQRAAVLGALAFAGAPFIVLYQRLAYSYNLLLLWSAVVLALVLLARRRRRPGLLWPAAAAAAAGLLTDQEGLALVAFVALAAWPDRRRAMLLAALGLVPAVAAAVAFIAVDPGPALQDWGFALLRPVASSGETGGAGSQAGLTALARWVVNYLHLLRAEWWWPAAVIGLFCIRPVEAQRPVLLLALLLAIPIFALREIEPFFRTALPLFVAGTWGLGALLDAGIDAAYRAVGAAAGEVGSRRIAGTVLAALVVVLPLGLEVGRTAGGVATGMESRIDWALVPEPEQVRARQAAALVNSLAGATDVVITSPHVTWLYGGRVVDFFQVAAYSGEQVAFYPPALPASRFRFEVAPPAARFAVVDGYWDRWAGQSAPVRQVTAAVERWPVLREFGQFRIHRNPALADALGR